MAANFSVSQPDVKRPLKSGKVIYNLAKTYQINKGENLNIRRLQAFNLVPEMGHPRSATRSSIAVATPSNLNVSQDEVEGNKIHCSPRDQSLSDLLYSKANGSNWWKTNNHVIDK